MGVWLPPPLIRKVPTSDPRCCGGRVLPGWPGGPGPIPEGHPPCPVSPAASGRWLDRSRSAGPRPRRRGPRRSPRPRPRRRPRPPSPQQATPTERAAAEVRPAIVYLTEKFTGYVADETGTYFNNGNPYELSVDLHRLRRQPRRLRRHRGPLPRHLPARTASGRLHRRRRQGGRRGRPRRDAARRRSTSAPRTGPSRARPRARRSTPRSPSSPARSRAAASRQALPARVVDSRPFDPGRRGAAQGGDHRPALGRAGHRRRRPDRHAAAVHRLPGQRRRRHRPEPGAVQQGRSGQREEDRRLGAGLRDQRRVDARHERRPDRRPRRPRARDQQLHARR